VIAEGIGAVRAASGFSGVFIRCGGAGSAAMAGKVSPYYCTAGT
jgi:hypothetical protein